MLRYFAAASVLGALAVVLMASLSGGDLDGRQASDGADAPMVNARTGEPLTLEMVQRDVEWHRETAKKLRDMR